MQSSSGKSSILQKNHVLAIRVQVEAGKAIASFSKDPIDGTSNLMQKKKKRNWSCQAPRDIVSG
jgi:hypothetical protein